ncbi:MAG: purine-nucleoside phosphorylase, partial [Myxococcota bacterium]|nr:purine-nucleoside phosphorylase [Myxococcota bacterium]
MTELAQVEAAARRLEARLGEAPPTAVVLGSGLGGIADAVEEPVTASFAEVGFPSTGVSGHTGTVTSGLLGAQRVTALAGRLHLYEGHPVAAVVRATRALARWGVQRIVFTSAVGSVNPSLHPGTVVRITDHINLTGVNPLIGPNIDELGPRFPDLSDAYDARLGAQVDQLAQDMGLPLPVGIYGGVLGPSYETAAEVQMLHRLGADVVGMSLISEVIAAVHAGLRVVAFGIVTNPGTGLGDGSVSHDSV